MYIYTHKHMYITHLAALSLSCSFQCLQRTHPAAFKKPPRHAGMYRHSQEHINWLSLSSSCVRVQYTAAHRQLTAADRQLAAAHSMQTGSSQQLTIALCISHMYIYMYKHMYITHLAALWLSCYFQCRQRTHPAAFKSPRDTRGYDTDTHRNTSIGSRAYMYLERRLGAEEVRVGVKTVMTAARRR